VVRCLSENANSGIFVSESLSSNEPIPVRRDTVVAFIGPAPRGPVGIPVTIGNTDEYLQCFGVSGSESPLFDAICQFFENGGSKAIVVRVCNSARCHCIVLPGPSGVLTLEAINPGPYESLRASIDYNGISSTDHKRFNLVLHRLASRDRPIVEQQEVYLGLSVDTADTDFIGHALLNSELVCIKGDIPDHRPALTFHLGVEVGASYIYVDSAWPEAGCLTDYDLIGSDTEGTGLFALDQVPSVDLVSLVSDTQDLGPVALFTAERYCRKRNAILLVDPPTHWQSIDDAVRSARESGFTSANVATYFPRSLDQGHSPASMLGTIAGAFSASDARDSIWELCVDAPLKMHGHIRLSLDLDLKQQHALKRVGINALRQTGRSHLELTGLVTMNRGSGCNTAWDQLRRRRTALFIIDTIAHSTRWAAFQDNNTETWLELRNQVQCYLRDLFSAGALSGANAEGAGYVVRDQNDNRIKSESGISFIVGFMLSGHGMQRFRFHQRPVECQIQSLHVEYPIALAS